MPSRHAPPAACAGESSRTAHLLLVLALAAPACSDDAGGGGDRDGAVPDVVSADVSSPDTSTSDTGIDADATTADRVVVDENPLPVDAILDRQDAPSCTPSAVWNNDSTGFAYSSGGGFAPRPLPDAGCDFISTAFDFSLSEGTLVDRDCSYSTFLDRTIHLTTGETARIVAALQALHTNCPVSPGCGADYPTNALTVRAAGLMTTYYGDFYAGCTNRTQSPSIAESDLTAFVNVLYSVVAESCQMDAGGSSDAGTCGPTLRDGGTTDAGPG